MTRLVIHPRVRVIGTGCLVLALAVAATAQPAPYSRFGDEGADFLGPATTPAASDTVRLGIVVPTTGVAAEAFRIGVELAIATANQRQQSPPLSAIFGADDGPWSSASATAVRLVHEAGVQALLAGPDGGRAHACELVAAKLWVPVLAPAAADHTIDYANVPWMFRLGPDDRQQLSQLLDHARNQGWKRLAWVGSDERDSRVAEGTAMRLAREAGDMLVAGRDLAEADALLVWGGVDGAPALVAEALELSRGRPLLGPWMLAAAGVAAAADTEFRFCLPAGERGLPPDGFRRRLPAGMSPAAMWMAALTYDAIDLLARAIRDGAATAADLRRTLATTDHQGISGTITFDGLGGRKSPALAVWRGHDLVSKHTVLSVD
jgi:ABC-type branched-subunit amino acid transport system substrate-binding protein